MSLRTLALLCLATFSARAADVVAWKTPLETLASDGKETPGLSRCEAPEPSPFFSPDDELWDLRAVSPEEVDWLVWNATTGRVVAKADMPALWRLHRKLAMGPIDLRYRLIVEVAEVPADRSPPVHGNAQAARLEVMGRSTSVTNENSARGQGEGWSIELDSSGTLDPDILVTDLWLHLTGRLQDHPPLVVETSITLHSGQRIWLARDFHDGHGLDVMLSVENVLPDGSPAEDAVQRDRNGPQPARPLLQTTLHKQAGGEWLAEIPVEMNTLIALRFANRPDEDPPDDGVLGIDKDLTLQAIATPASVRQHVEASLLDVREWLDVIWPELKGRFSFAGYDPLREALVIQTPDRAVVKEWEGIFLAPRIHETDGELPILTLTGKDEVRLATRCGRRSRIARGEIPDDFERAVVVETWDDILRVEALNAFGGDWDYDGKIEPDRTVVLPPDDDRPQPVRVALTTLNFYKPALEREKRR